MCKIEHVWVNVTFITHSRISVCVFPNKIYIWVTCIEGEMPYRCPTDLAFCASFEQFIGVILSGKMKWNNTTLEWLDYVLLKNSANDMRLVIRKPFNGSSTSYNALLKRNFLPHNFTSVNDRSKGNQKKKKFFVQSCMELKFLQSMNFLCKRVGRDDNTDHPPCLESGPRTP